MSDMKVEDVMAASVGMMVGLRARLTTEENRSKAAEARCAKLIRALMGLSFPRTGDHGGPLVQIVAHYEDGSKMVMGHEEPRLASKVLQEATGPQTKEAGQPEG